LLQEEAAQEGQIHYPCTWLTHLSHLPTLSVVKTS
jgi:hypothetical protein